MMRVSGMLVALILFSIAASGQTPQPFPRPAGSLPQPQEPQPQLPRSPAPSPEAAAPVAPATSAAVDAPDAATVYFPVYPTAQFLASYDAGRGQRYYIYGTTAPYGDLVTYYRGQLRERGNEVFSQPPTHVFEMGRFREDSMAFPPGVTLKDWTSGGSQGYPNRHPSAGQPDRFPSIIMIVPPPPAPAR